MSTIPHDEDRPEREDSVAVSEELDVSDQEVVEGDVGGPDFMGK